ncbi:hypothetical protein J5N97_004217 [Dioscorea zingiberensis]|uniref:Uncharacterized protein n=1 Tax=Dioscorea zingiberensis TaxID=325984 RepID=A0A9D5HRI3_9LILI|nr:hypothetical protein J5N97_004217 [Dioscorea zingiberensis]
MKKRQNFGFFVYGYSLRAASGFLLRRRLPTGRSSLASPNPQFLLPNHSQCESKTLPLVIQLWILGFFILISQD